MTKIFDYKPKELDTATVVYANDDFYTFEFIKDGETVGIVDFQLAKKEE